jgi:hypothetical protein
MTQEVDKTVDTLLEIRVFQVFFTNTYLEPQRFFTERERPLKVFWKTKKGFGCETLLKGFPEII